MLVGFNLPNIAGVALNQPLIYTFSDNVDPSSVTPDTIQVTGPAGFGFTFESIVVDSNLVAELPRNQSGKLLKRVLRDELTGAEAPRR